MMPHVIPSSLPIGFRRGWGDWQRDLAQLISFARENQFAFVDFGPAPVEDLRRVIQAGVAIGSVDLKDWKAMLSPDPTRRAAAIQANVRHVIQTSALGVRLFLTAMIPEDPAGARADHFALAVESYERLLQATESTGARILLEGWPGPAPWFPTLACTPADCRALFAAIPSTRLGINYDPSHLVRMGIEPVRFLREFAARVHHVHAKDTILSTEEQYDHGHTQPATFAPPHRHGGFCWRYAIPGRGAVPWTAIWGVLRDVAYRGGISIELEDQDFTTSGQAERDGLLAARCYLNTISPTP